MLFGENASSSDGSNKRKAKASDKDDMRSKHSGKTNKSKRSIAGTKFGDCLFIKKGEMKG
jgi:hypothetical protein